jgi:hypothetical protein
MRNFAMHRETKESMQTIIRVLIFGYSGALSTKY